MIRKNVRVWLGLMGWLMCIGVSMARQASHPDTWRQFLSETKSALPGEANKNHYFLVHVNSLPEGFNMQSAGYVPIRKLDRTTWIVKAESQVKTDLPGFLAANNLWKLSPNLNLTGSTEEVIWVVIKTRNYVSTVAKLEALSVDYRALSNQLIRLSLTKGMIQESLLQWPEVTYIGRESSRAIEESRVLDMNLNPNKVNRIHHAYPELDGRGRVLSIRESAYDIDDLDLRARHLPSSLEGSVVTNHATEMATIAAGAGNSSLNGRGVAKGVTLTSSFLEDLFPDEDGQYQLLNAWVQNHSYGTEEVENFYGAMAQAYDQLSNRNPKLLHVFSAGNLGEGAPASGPYFGVTGRANLSGNFKLSKNSLAVASVDTVGRTLNFVSKGPAHDGRMKPELVTYSVFGSSNSAAMVSGTAILLQQAYHEQYDALPESALVKNLLINSAADVGNTGPDYATGYGNMDAFRAMENLKAGQFTSGEVRDGETVSFDITIPPTARNLKVTLTWNDPAAEVNSNLALVNDLDLSLSDGNGQTWLPWVLNPEPGRLDDEAARGRDGLNNVEQVSLDVPEAGVIQLNVSGFDIPEDSQSFYLSWQWDVAESFDWSFPTGSDNMPYNGETVSYFRWQSTLSADMGKLEYSTDNGNTWELIATDVPLAQGHYRWHAPELTTAALARMVVGDEEFVTEQFTISRPQRIGVGFSCADSVRLQWSALQGAEAYEILTFGERDMESVTLVTDTAFTFSKSNYSTRFFSVQPLLSGSVRPIRASTFDYDQQGVGCYLFSFSTELDPDSGVFINLVLGTIAGVTAVQIERQVEDGIFDIITVRNGPGLSAQMRLLDPEPFQGLNNYRARLLFDNGEEVVTDVSSAYFLTSRPFLIFPNPLPRGERLNVFSKVFPDDQVVILSLYDQTGLRLFDETVTSDRFGIDLSRLQPGIYFYRITSEGYLYKGRVVLE